MSRTINEKLSGQLICNGYRNKKKFYILQENKNIVALLKKKVYNIIKINRIQDKGENGVQIAIVDDNAEMLELTRRCIADCQNVSECTAFQNPRHLLEQMEKGRRYELYLLDIEMPDLDGLELAKRIRREQKEAYIVFITSHSRFAVASYDFEIRAYQYIIKADLYKKLPEVLRRISEEAEAAEKEIYVIETPLHCEKIKTSDILYIYKMEKNTIFVMRDGKEHKERKTLKEVYQLLRKPEFLFVNSGNIINMRRIRRIDRNEIILENDQRIPVSRASLKKVKEKMMDYWGKNG